MPSLLTMVKWDSDVAPEAVLLSPADVRQTWLDFMMVRHIDTRTRALVANASSFSLSILLTMRPLMPCS